MNTQILQQETRKSRKFYEEVNRESYSAFPDLQSHPVYHDLVKFVKDCRLRDKKCLEIGSSTGIFQDLVADYTGLDVSGQLQQYYHKPYFLVKEDGSYPFEDKSFEAIWSFAVHEHIPDLQQALLEISRVLKSGGVLFFWPAWFCRPWAAEGYAVRPYRDLELKGKVIKALIPLRDSILWRSLFIFPKRFFRQLLGAFGKKYNKISFKPLKANYDRFWLSDSDACNHIDPHDAILWFQSNGFECLSHPTRREAFWVRHEPLIFKKV
jgi:SAM-dependent methyltransferase